LNVGAGDARGHPELSPVGRDDLVVYITLQDHTSGTAYSDSEATAQCELF